MRITRSGFTLLETVVALTLFGGVLLSMLATGQIILSQLHESDQRLRSSVYAQSLLDSLRGTACARLTSGSATYGPFNAAWAVTDLLDATRIDLTIVTPLRAGPAQSRHTTALLTCNEP